MTNYINICRYISTDVGISKHLEITTREFSHDKKAQAEFNLLLYSMSLYKRDCLFALPFSLKMEAVRSSEIH